MREDTKHRFLLGDLVLSVLGPRSEDDEDFQAFAHEIGVSPVALAMMARVASAYPPPQRTPDFPFHRRAQELRPGWCGQTGNDTGEPAP